MRGFILAWFALFLPTTALSQPLAFAPVISDGAVVQRDAPITIAGTGQPNTEITVTLGPEERVVSADVAGNWTAVFPRLPATS